MRENRRISASAIAAYTDRLAQETLSIHSNEATRAEATHMNAAMGTQTTTAAAPNASILKASNSRGVTRHADRHAMVPLSTSFQAQSA